MIRDREAGISRRGFCSFAVLLSPTAGMANASAPRRIGVLELGAPVDWIEKGRGDALRARGWVEGRNLRVERRYYMDRSEALVAEELVRSTVEIIVTVGTRATLAAKRATATVPIVFDSAGDPVLMGLVASLARPGGNVTGYSVAGPEITSKGLSVLKELLPRIARVGVLQDAHNPYNAASRPQLEQVCRALGLVAIVKATDNAGVLAAIDELAREDVQALMFDDDIGGWQELVALATQRGLPTLASDQAAVRSSGALIGYGSTWAELWSRRAEYVDRILRGAKPADLPVQQPTKFELAINLKTARALKLAIPPTLLARADDVVE